MEKPAAADSTNAPNGATESTSFKVTDRRFWARGVEEKPADEPRREEKPTYVKELEQKLSEKEKLVAQTVAALRRVEQEKTRFVERLEREKEQELERERGRLVVPLFAVLDSFERSVAACRQSDSTSSIVEGLTLIEQQFVEALAGLGVTPIEALGQPFDPTQHEAVMTAEARSEEENGTVVEVFRRGYRTATQVLRPSMVKVARSS